MIGWFKFLDPDWLISEVKPIAFFLLVDKVLKKSKMEFFVRIYFLIFYDHKIYWIYIDQIRNIILYAPIANMLIKNKYLDLVILIFIYVYLTWDIDYIDSEISNRDIK